MKQHWGIPAPRCKTRQIHVGTVPIGGDAPIAVQTMTNTPTKDATATLAQIRKVAEAGADLVRVSVPDPASAKALRRIVAESPIPVIADIHFSWKLALAALDAGVQGLRINPGNIGARKYVARIVEAAAAREVPIRIGVNAGSLETRLLEKYGEPTPEAMVESALDHIRILEELGYREIKISLKASNVPLTVAAYRLLARACDYPLHLGITEAGGPRAGTVKSAVGLGILLAEGIGDTIRVSLAADPVEEVKVGHEILKSLGLASRGVNIVACPSCARQKFEVIDTVAKLEEALAHIREPVTVAIIGCVVNGPGEAREADIGITGGYPVHTLYRHGERVGKVRTEELVERVVREVEALVAERRKEAA